MATVPQTLRVLTLNLWGDNGEHLRRMETAIAEAKALRLDLIGLQEVRQARGRLTQAEEFARAIGGHYEFAAADPDSPGGPIGNAVVSRFPLSRPEHMKMPAPTGDHRCALAVDV